MEKVSAGATVVMDPPGSSTEPGGGTAGRTFPGSAEGPVSIPAPVGCDRRHDSQETRWAKSWCCGTGRRRGEMVVLRQGKAGWSRSGQHTSVTDLPLLPEGEEQARDLRTSLADRSF